MQEMFRVEQMPSQNYGRLSRRLPGYRLNFKVTGEVDLREPEAMPFERYAKANMSILWG